MKKAINVIILLFIVNITVYSQKELDCQKYFNNIINLIGKYSSRRGEYMGMEADSITRSVYNIVYVIKDSCIKIEEKFDIINLMVYYQRYSSDSYRAMVFFDIKNDSMTYNEILFALPLMFCNQCSDKMINKIKKYNKEDLYKYVHNFPDPYRSYYLNLIEYAYSKSDDSIKSDFLLKKIIENKLFKDEKFRKKYELFFR
jgi:hypothetical protein